MINDILYFPYINLPNNKWSIKSILYWDTVGTIVPYDFLEYPDALSDFMKEAVQTGHIVQRFTSEFQHLQAGVDRSIMENIRDPSFPLLVSQQNFNSGLTSKIYYQKFSYPFFEELVSLNLAIKRGTWYHVETKVAAMMMTTLANAIAKELNNIASTDIPFYTLRDNLLGLVKNNPERIRSHLLEGIMPFPVEVELSNLIKFKEKYSDQLKNFRLSIDKLVWTLSGIVDEEVRKNLLETNIQQINEKKDELIARLNENKIGKIAYGAVKGMLIDTAIAIISGNVILPAATILGTINEVIRQHEGNPIKNEELAYVALMESNLEPLKLF